ncbi:MAG: NAD(P)-dependent dehydrogenase (short-subunit alcohol dehydrogenase family) [Planctomycetota bacterium]|jgi:NAD(P)-dependent dehydrogenase (short-subunit alcohol dehydrogenase family)
MQTAIIIGVGPIEGLGAQLCRRFAQKKFHVHVAGRSEAKLDDVVSLIESEGGQASTCVTDATDETQVINLFDKATLSGSLALAVYNVGNNTPGRISEMDADSFINSWKSGCYGGFLFAREATRRMQPNNAGTILFTGASASLRGRANFGAFNSAKAALRTLAQALAKEVGPEGIHVGHIIIDGSINGEKIKNRFPEYAEKLGEDGMVDLQGIVDAYEFMYEQKKSAWSFEIDIRTSIENW